MRAWLLVPTLALCACASTPAPTPQPATPPAAWSRPQPPIAGTPALDAPDFARLRALALSNNPDLAAAQARVRQALAQRDVVAAAALPQLNGTLGAGKLREVDGYGSRDGRLQRLPPMERWDGGGLLEFAYSPDLFGHVARERESAEASGRASAAEHRDAARVLEQQLFDAYLDATLHHALQQQSAEALDAATRLLAVAERRVGAGLADRGEQERARVRLAHWQQQRAAWQLAEERARIRVAVLCGQPPSALDWQPGALPSLPATGPATLPAQVLDHRPDVDAAWQRLNSAASDSQRARLERYPRLQLSGKLLLADLVGWAVQGGLRLPLLDGGRIAAGVSQADAAFAEAEARYRQVVLHAYQDVEAALAAQAAAQDGLRWADDAVAQSQSGRRRSQALLRQGVVGQDALQQARLDAVDAVVAQLQQRHAALQGWGALQSALARDMVEV